MRKEPVKLREALASDISKVFLNTEEFAFDICLNGQIIQAVVDEGHAPYDSGSGRGSGFADASGLGLQVTTLTIRIRQADAAGLMPEQLVTVDDEQWIIDSIKKEDGIAVVVMRQAYS
jgi:hypothetical protein